MVKIAAGFSSAHVSSAAQVFLLELDFFFR